MDLGLGAHVHALRGLVEDQQVGRADEPSAQRDLLLVAAGEQPHGRVERRGLHRQRVHQARGGRALGGAVEQAVARDQRQRGQREVRRDWQVEHDAVTAAVFGKVRDAGRNRFLRRTRTDVAARDAHRSGVARGKPEQHARQLGAAGADQPRQAHDLAAPDGEADVADAGLARRQALDFEDGRADGDLALREDRGDVAADHQLDQAAASTDAMGSVPTVRPSRSTVTRSASRGSSSRRCEM